MKLQFPASPLSETGLLKEISLNARDPHSKITILPESNVKSEWNLPAVKYQFVTRLEFNDLPHNRVCDVIGLVTYVGRSERLRKRDEWEDFWIYRWVQMIDGTSDQPFLLEIFATSQPDIFENICPMSYLVCTQMRVIREYPEDISYKAYLTTTNESQVFITGHHKGQPYISDEKVKNYIKWMKTQHEAEIKNKMTIGGYHPYPPIPSTFTKFCNDRKPEEILTTIRELKAIVEQLHYREHKRVAVQGILAACAFVQNTSTKEMSLQHKEHGFFQKPNVLNIGSTEPSCEEQVPCRTPAAVDQSENHSKRSAEQLTPLAEAYNVIKRRKKPESGVGLMVSESENFPAMQHLGGDVDSLCNDEGTASQGTENEASDETSYHGLYWENPLWSEVKHNIMEHLYYGKLFPESFTQKFDYRHREILMQQYNLHPAKVTSLIRPLSSFTSATRLGHYQLTILGINQDIAVDVSLPVSENFSVFGNIDLPSSLQCAGTSNNDEIQDHSLLSLRGELEEYARTQDRLHVICILDICHLGESKVEIILNRVYCPTVESTD